MATEESNALRKTKLGIGGDADYLSYLIEKYGPDETVAYVAKAESERLKKPEDGEEAKQ